MKDFFEIKRVFLMALLLFVVSCIPKKDILYYQNIDKELVDNLNSYEIKVQPDDLLSINVSAEDPEIVAPFNLNPQNVVGQQSGSAQSSNLPYLVDAAGYVNFPVLGKLKLSGLTHTEVLTLFQNKVSKYINNPIITVRLLNFKVAIQGAVSAPGTYTSETDRLTVIQALAKAGDITDIGNRKNVMIIRDNNGLRTVERLDLTKANFMSSPYFYLAQNDVIYVEQGYSTMNPNTRLYATVTSIFLSIVTFVIAIAK